MKKITKTITGLILVLTLISCSKSTDLARPNSGEPVVNSITWSPVYAGSNMSIMFKITINVSEPVTRMNLIRAKDEVVLDYENNPQSGTITMYDHMVESMPLEIHKAFYFLEFKMADGTVVRGDRFQVH